MRYIKINISFLLFFVLACGAQIMPPMPPMPPTVRIASVPVHAVPLRSPRNSTTSKVAGKQMKVASISPATPFQINLSCIDPNTNGWVGFMYFSNVLQKTGTVIFEEPAPTFNPGLVMFEDTNCPKPLGFFKAFAWTTNL